MLRGAIALVLVKTIQGVLLVHSVAQTVAVNFGQNGRGRDGGHQCVALDDGLCTYGQGGQAVAINQHQLRRQSQSLYRPLHGQQGGLQDVDLVYFLHTGLGNRKTQGPRPDLVKQGFAAFGGEFFGVVQTLNGIQVVQDHRCGDHRTRQRSAPGLVHACCQA